MFRLSMQRFALLLLCQVFMLANATEVPKQTTITCKVNKSTGSGIFLYKVENGEAVSLGFRRPDEIRDTCIFSIPVVKEGIYFLRKGGVHSSEFRHVIYLKPGDNKQVDLYLDNSSVDFDSCGVKNPNKETVYLQAWNTRFNELVKKGANRAKREDFIASYNQLLKDVPALKSKAVPANPFFNRMIAAKLDAELQFLKAGSFFYFGERMNGDYDAKNAAFYKSQATQKFCDAKLLQSEHGLALLNYVFGYRLLQKYGTQEQMQATPFEQKAKMICSDAVRVAYVSKRMEQVRSYEQFTAEIMPFKKLFNTQALKIVYGKKLDELTIFAKGAVAYNFSLEDTKGKMVSLSDFKGKVVVVDIWAMWCAPCLTEKPFYQKVEEEFKHRDDIVFIGISHDGLSRKTNWKDFVAKKGWKNIELIANYNESVGKYYKIEGIPRFMIFDKEAKIVTVDAPRPSDPAFKKLIEQTLQIEDRVSNF